MCRKLFLSVLMTLTLGLLVNSLAQAAIRTWDHEGGDNRWDTAANWSNDRIAGEGDTARIVLTGGDECRIDSAVSAAVSKMQVGWLVDDVPLAGDLRILGGSLDIAEALQLGCASTGQVLLEGGTVNINGDLIVGSTLIEVIEDPYEEIPHPGTGRLTMTGGLITIPDANSLQIGTNGSTGQLNLWGGTIMAGALEIGASASGGIMDIRGGTLILDGDQRGEIRSYIKAGLITAYGGWSGAELQYNYCTTNFKKTTLTAIPEPATIALLGLGGFALIRRCAGRGR